MKNAKQILSLFLTASLLLSVFVSCGEGAGTTDSPTTPSVSAEPEVAADNGDGAVNDRLNIPDGIPELKFDGREFRVGVEAAKEYEILAYLMRNKNIALSRDRMLQDIWGYDFFGDDRTIDTHIKNLRGRLGKYRDKITTVRGIGYKFED